MEIKGKVRYIDGRGFIEVSKEDAWKFHDAGIIEEGFQVSGPQGVEWFVRLREGVEIAGKLSCDGIHKGVLI